MADIKKLVEEIKELKLIEVAELVKALETEFGVSAAASVAVSAGGPVAAAVEVEEKTEFDVILKDIGPNKLNVIKVVREITSLGLGEAKALVESAPKAIKEAVSKDIANQLAEKIKATGATVEVK